MLLDSTSLDWWHPALYDALFEPAADPDRVLVIRYRDIVDDPAGAVDRVCGFLGIDESHVSEIPRDNARSFVDEGWRSRLLGPAIRTGA